MELNSLEQCNVCRKTMIDPRILECSHSFCLKCLESSTVSDESPRCPTCQIAFLRPHGGNKYLKKNEFIEQLNNLKERNINCDVCRENEAVKYCVECSFNYCSTCLVLHGRIPTSSNHALQLITGRKYETLQKDTNGLSNLTCDEHSELIKLFCKDCNVVLCDQCLNQCDHVTQDISQYFETVKLEIEEKLEIKEEFIRNVIINLEDARRNMCEDEFKASILKREIKKRGEVVKKAVDLYVSKLIKSVDKESKKHQKQADAVMKELENMKSNSDADIQSLKEHLSNLNYKNVIEKLSAFENRNENIPKYSESFEVTFVYESSQPQMNLEKTLGSLRKAPELRLVGKYQLGANYPLFAPHQDDILLSQGSALISIYNCNQMEFKVSQNLTNMLSSCYQGDLLSINGILYVMGTYNSYPNNVPLQLIRLIKVDASFKCEPQIIYECCHNSGYCKLSKSHSGNIVLILYNKIIILNGNGVSLKTLDLKDKFQITNALQLDEQRYVVCCQHGEVYIINDFGDQIKKFSSSNECHQMLSACLEKDDYGNIYVGDRNVLVLDRDLNFKSLEFIHSANEKVHKMCYDEASGMLLVVVGISNKGELLKFKL